MNIRTKCIASLLVLLTVSISSTSGVMNSGSGIEAAGTTGRDAGFDTVRTNLNDYIWPTDASRHVTSSFAEYRSTHFHGGIDISTNGQKGYKVFAVRDGYVYRIRITPNGYGKMLYVKHSDGYVSTYAHLQMFNEAITRAARDAQYRHVTYAVDTTFTAMSLPVKKGDVIAYTGDTGFGPPHLHFELRDENLNPVNPLLSPNYTFEDNIPPLIRRVMIAPLDYQSTVDNSSSPKLLSRFPRSHHVLVIPQMITVHGRIGFGVAAEDRSNGTSSKAGIHALKLTVDDSLAFAMELNRVPAEETKQVDLDYDLPMILQGWGKFQKLYIDTGNSLPFYDGKPEGTGIINTEQLREGKHEYRIACSDFHGNTTELRGSFLINRTPVLRITNVDDDGITLSGTNVEIISKFTLYGKRFSAPSWTQYTLNRGRFEADATGVELPMNTKQYDILKIVAETKWGSHALPLFHFMHKPQDSPRNVYIKIDPFDDYVRFTLTSTGMFTETPVLSVREGNSTRKVDVQPVDLYKYAGSYVPSDAIAGRRQVEVQAEINGKPSTAKDEFEIYSIPSRTGGSFSANPSGLKFSYDSGAVFKPLFMQISSESYRGSTVYTLEPQDRLLDDGVRVSVPYDASEEWKHPGLYFRSNGGWILQAAQPDAGRHTFTAKLSRTLGELCVLPDNEPPTLSRLRVLPRRGKVYVAFHYYDNLSGVDTDEIKMYIDGNPAIPEIDGEHHQVWYQAEEQLPRGKHSLRITTKDQIGNKTELSRTFTVR